MSFDGWEQKTIGDILTLEYGKPLPKPDRDPNGAYPVYGANGVKAKSNKFYYDQPTILVGRKGSAGECNLTESKFWPLDVTYFVKFDEQEYDLKFLFYMLRRQDLPSLAKGVKPGINRNDVYAIEVAVPDKAEQKRIVSILDESFSAIAKAKENAEKNLLSARELFESYLNRVFTQQGPGWQEKKLDDVCEVIRRSSPRPIKQYLTDSDDGVNWIKIGDATGNDKYISSTKQKITRKGAERSRKVSPGDLLLTNSMSYGKAYIMAIDGYVHDGWFVLRNFAGTFELDFFFIILTSSYLQMQFGNLAAGAVVKNISGDLVKKAMLPIPPMDEQRRIVAQVEERLALTKRLETIYTQKLANLDELKQSLLQKAFTGQLTKGNGVPVSSTLPFPVSIGGISKTDLHAGVLGLAFLKHELPKTSHFGHVKGEKIAHLVESLVGIDLGRSPIKDAAGPNDFQHLKKVESRAKKAGFFEVTRQEDRYFLKPKDNFEGLLEKTKSCLGKRMAEVEELLSVMAPMTTRQAEIFATTFAAWNNLLVLGRPTDDDSIV